MWALLLLLPPVRAAAPNGWPLTQATSVKAYGDSSVAALSEALLFALMLSNSWPDTPALLVSVPLAVTSTVMVSGGRVAPTARLPA